VVRDLTVVALSLWVGIMACVAFLVAPAAFGTLEREAAGRMMSTLFPRYYAAGLALGLAAAAGALARGRPESWAAWTALGAIALMLAFTAYSALVLLPEIRTLAPVPPGARPERLARLHGLAMMANAAVFLAGVVALALTVARGRP
jgi:Domain of unknown function (DUF4149)